MADVNTRFNIFRALDRHGYVVSFGRVESGNIPRLYANAVSYEIIEENLSLKECLQRLPRLHKELETNAEHVKDHYPASFDPNEAIDPDIPMDPFIRKVWFASLTEEEQAMVFYSVLTKRNADENTVCDWLLTPRDTLSKPVIRETVLAAVAETNIKVMSAFRHWLSNTKNPQGSSSAMFFLKARAKWSDKAGDMAIGAGDVNLNVPKDLFENLSVIDTDRDPKTGQTISEPTELKLVKSGGKKA